MLSSNFFKQQEMAATASPPDNRQASNNTTTGATVTVCIILLIIILGYLTHRFRSKVTSAMVTRPSYRDNIREAKIIETRYRNLERIPVLLYNSNIQIEYHETTKMERKAGRKAHQEVGSQSDTTRSIVETKAIAGPESGAKDQVANMRARLSGDPTEILPSQSSESNSGVGIENHSPQSPPPTPTLTSTSTQHKDIITEEEGSATCSICVSPFRVGENVRILPCGNHHIYHHRCIDPWLLGFAWTCPLW